MYHMFPVEVAAEYGVNAAILLHNINYWCLHNEANGKCYHDGYYWTYNSRKAFTALFPYMSDHQVGTALQKLIDAKVIVTGNYNKSAYDRTMWYAVTVYGKSILQNCKMERAEIGNPNAGDGAPIPDSNTDSNTDGEEEIVNPFGYDTSDMPVTVEAYVAGFIPLSPVHMDELKSFIYDDKLPEELVRYAVDEAVKEHAMSWHYVRAILQRCVDNGYKSVEEAEGAWKRTTAGQRGKKDAPQPSDDNPLLRTKFY